VKNRSELRFNYGTKNLKWINNIFIMIVKDVYFVKKLDSTHSSEME
jgi:hypothetical protein